MPTIRPVENALVSGRAVARICLLGPMRAIGGLGENILPKSRRGRAVLAVLCLSGGRPVDRGRLSGLLWDRVEEQHARASLRQVIGEFAPFAELTNGAIAIGREEIQLDLSRCWVDALSFVGAPDTTAAENADYLREPYAAQGGFLANLDGIAVSFDHWLASERSRFENALREQRDSIFREALTSGDLDRCISAARRLLAVDPAHERAWQVLMRALAEQGDRAQALREYQHCQEVLKRLFDVEPCLSTIKVGERLRSGAMPLRMDIPRLDPDAQPIQATGEHNPADWNEGFKERGRVRVGVHAFTTIGSSCAEVTADILAQEVTAALSRFRWIDVVAVAASGPNGHPDRKRLLQSMGIDYAIDGTMRVSGDRLWVSAFLLDVHDLARTIWSARFDTEVTSPHSTDENVISPLVAQVDSVLLMREGHKRDRELAKSHGALSPDHATFVLSAIPRLYSMERAAYDQAGRLLAQAIELAPHEALAHAWLAFWHVFFVGQGWSTNPNASFREAERLCLQARRLDPESAQAFGIHGHICAFLHRDFDSALALFDRALTLNPNLAFIWALSAPTYCYIGEPARAIENLDRYRRLTPLDPYFPLFETIYTVAYTFAADYERAAQIGRRSVRANPDFTNGYKPLLAALGHLGLIEEAASYRERLLALEPGFCLRSFAATYPFQRSQDRERYVEGLRKAGVPEFMPRGDDP